MRLQTRPHRLRALLLASAFALACSAQADPGESAAMEGASSQATHGTSGLEIDDEQLCQESGGLWDLLSCGDYHCGEFPDCDAIIPGCNCGPLANFAQAEGCVADVACALFCGGIAGLPCPVGAVCYDQPGDGCGPLCGADCGGICAYAPLQTCGGLAGQSCQASQLCVDDSQDNCDPSCGGTDCQGVCVSMVPEPSAGLLGLVAVAVTALCARRSRWRKTPR